MPSCTIAVVSSHHAHRRPPAIYPYTPIVHLNATVRSVTIHSQHIHIFLIYRIYLIRCLSRLYSPPRLRYLIFHSPCFYYYRYINTVGSTHRPDRYAIMHLSFTYHVVSLVSYFRARCFVGEVAVDNEQHDTHSTHHRHRLPSPKSRPNNLMTAHLPASYINLSPLVLTRLGSQRFTSPPSFKVHLA